MLRLCCVVVGVVTTVNNDSFIFVQDEDLVFAMLYECRRSCRVNYREIKRWMILDSFQEKYAGKPLPEIIQTYGGLEDHVVDVFGFKTPICAENGALATQMRVVQLLFRRVIAKLLSKLTNS